MSTDVETFLDNLFETDGKEMNKKYTGKKITGSVWIDQYGFKTKIISGIVLGVYYSKTADTNIYKVKSDEDSKIYNIYEFDIIRHL